MIQQVLSSSR